MRAAAPVASMVVVLLTAACRPGEEASPPSPTPRTLVIVTPAPTVAATPIPGVARRYSVQPGDTLSGIAAMFGVEEDAIAEANGLGNYDQLFAGQELVIPAPRS